MNAERVVLHVDMNAYFASIEQRGNPFLRGRPLLVVADSRRRSVVMTASYEARAFGVKTGMNLYEARKLCPQALTVDGNSEKYLYFTSRIKEVLRSFSDQVEMISCDEAYLDVTGSQNRFGADGEGIAELIRRKIKDVTALPCSVGVAPNKLLAKLASEKKKPDGLTVIRTEEIEELLSHTHVEELCGIGNQWKRKLNQIGIFTCKQLGASNLEWLQHHFGFWGYWLQRMGQGKDDSPVCKSTDKEPVKSVGHSTTFPRDTIDLNILKSFLLLLGEKVSARLRAGQLEGRTVSLCVRYKDFTTFSYQKAVQDYTDDGYHIYRVALGLLDSIVPLAQPVRLLGASVSSLVPKPRQSFLFSGMERKNKINKAIDQINKKFGRFTVKPAGLIAAEQFGILEAPIPPSQHTF